MSLFVFGLGKTPSPLWVCVRAHIRDWFTCSDLGSYEAGESGGDGGDPFGVMSCSAEAKVINFLS